MHAYAEAGAWTLDGQGAAAGVLSANADGVPVALGEAFTATYEVVSGCVFSAMDAFGPEFELYTTPSREGMTYFSPGFSGTMVRQ